MSHLDSDPSEVEYFSPSKDFKFVFQDLCANGMYCLAAVVIFEIIVFGLGMILTYILKKVPYLKTLI